MFSKEPIILGFHWSIYSDPGAELNETTPITFHIKDFLFSPIIKSELKIDVTYRIHFTISSWRRNLSNNRVTRHVWLRTNAPPLSFKPWWRSNTLLFLLVVVSLMLFKVNGGWARVHTTGALTVSFILVWKRVILWKYRLSTWMLPFSACFNNSQVYFPRS